MGLAVAYGIVQQHGGEIRVESEVSRGTRFFVALPAGPRAGTAEGEGKAPGESRVLGAGR